MIFETPEWFIILIIIPLVVILGIFAWRRRNQNWKAIVAERLKAQLTRTRSAKRYFIALSLSMVGFIFLVTSIAMPENGEEFIETRQEGRNILLCFDLSQSMLTLDSGAGTRLAAAKGAALEIAERFPSDRIGLLVFAGEIQLIVPLTIDHAFLNESITQLDPIDLTYGGSNLAEAIKDSTRILNKTGQRNNVLVVFSDGEDHSSGIESAASAATNSGVFIYSLGFGSKEGDFIRDPRSRDGFFYDRNGNRVLSQLKEESLRRIADQTRGVYSRAQDGNFLSSLAQAVSKMDRFEEEGGHERIAKPVYQWFLLPGLLFLVSAFILQRLPVAAPVAALILAFLGTSPPAEANNDTTGLIDDLMNVIKTPEAQPSAIAQPSAKALKFKKSAAQVSGDRKARFNMAAGAADYEEKNWSAAAQSFGEALLTKNEHIRQEAHYALANSLFYKGREQGAPEEQMKSWEGAVSHYEESLKLNDDQSAQENLDFLKKLIEKKKQEQQQKQEQQDQQQQDQKNEESQDENKKQPESSDQTDESESESQEPQDQSDSSDQPDQKQAQGPPESEDPENENQGSEAQEQAKEKTGGGSEKEDQKNENASSENNQEIQQSQSNSEQPDPKENSLERARRILREQADFGGKPPRARRRTYRRPEKDW